MKKLKNQFVAIAFLALMFSTIPSLVFANGACCTATGCVEATNVMDCMMNYNGMWVGDGTSCSDDPPPCEGACCYGGGCIDGVDNTACTALYNGLFLGLGTTCSGPDVCIGACCVDTVCQQLNMVECANLSGVFQSPGVPCDPNPCLEPIGACCYNGGCLDLTPTECVETYNGRWQGTHVSCSDPDLCLGACCIGDSCHLVDEAECDQLDGLFSGPGTSCSPNPCNSVIGACCISLMGITCSQMSESDCLFFGPMATFHGEGTFCDGIDGNSNSIPDICEDIVGACCYSEDSCLMQTDLDCQLGGGVFKGIGTDCSTLDICESSSQGGACCTMMQGCLDLADQVTCEGGPYFGTWMGEGTSCSDDPSPCLGACCTSTGCIDNVDAMNCMMNHAGIFVGIGTSCSDDPPPCNGACCYEGGCIDGIDAATCISTYNGDFLGVGTSCNNPDICDGACCVDEVCQYASRYECEDLSGSFQGVGSSCDPNPCILPLGACCTATGCVQATGPECVEILQGSFKGVGISCSDPDVCKGACCIDDSCQFVDETECDLLGGSFNGINSYCDPNPCGALGACCVMLGGSIMCFEQTEDACAVWGPSAVYHGDGTYCDGIDGNMNLVPDICESLEGACCYSDGTCLMKTDQDCQLDGGEFKGIGTDCSTSDICPQTGYEYLPGDANMTTGIWPPATIGGDVTYLVNYFRGLTAPCMLDGFYAAADANGSCSVTGADVTKLVSYFRGITDLEFCPDYPTTWPPIPDTAPDGWPNCASPILSK